eukprot:5363775-Amphidinium_carterae.1
MVAKKLTLGLSEAFPLDRLCQVDIFNNFKYGCDDVNLCSSLLRTFHAQGMLLAPRACRAFSTHGTC